jgi:hypothetical protein
VDHLKAVAISKRIIESHRRKMESDRESIKQDLIDSFPAKAEIEEWLTRNIEKRLTNEMYFLFSKLNTFEARIFFFDLSQMGF